MSAEEFQSVLRYNKIAFIQSGDALSNAVDLFGTSIVAISTPAEYDGTGVTIYGSETFAGTYKEVRNISNVSCTIDCEAGYYYALTPFDLSSVRYVKLLSNTNQTQDCEITLVTRPI